MPDELPPLSDGGMNSNRGPVDVLEMLKDATAAEAQLALSLIVWPSQAPDPRVVGEWVVRRLQSRRDFEVAPGEAPYGHFRHSRHV